MKERPHQRQRQEFHRLSRRSTLALSGIVGALAGLMAVLFRVLVEKLHALRGEYLPGVWEDLGYPGFALIIAGGAGLGALAAWLTRAFCPEAAGSGIPDVKAVLITGHRLRWARLIPLKVGGALLALGAGFSLGREGPTVHVGGATAEAFADFFSLPGRTRRALISAGAGAGLAAAFNAPLAGFLFVMEELRRDISRETYGNALVSSISSVGVTLLLLGYDATFDLPDLGPLHLSYLPAVCLVGLAATLVGGFFNLALLRVVRNNSHRVTKGAIAGALGGTLALTLPAVTGGGETWTERLLTGQAAPLALQSLAILLAIKLLYTVFCYGTGVPGGIFSPLLTMGAVLGSLIAGILSTFSPHLSPEPQRLATVGMAAVLTSSVRSPLTGVVLIVEMTGEYHMLYSLLLAAFVANVSSEFLGLKPIYEALLERNLAQKCLPGEHEARMLDLAIEPASALDGAKIRTLDLPPQLHIAAILREDSTMVAQGDTRLKANDFLTVVVGAGCPAESVEAFLESTRAP